MYHEYDLVYAGTKGLQGLNVWGKWINVASPKMLHKWMKIVAKMAYEKLHIYTEDVSHCTDYIARTSTFLPLGTIVRCMYNIGYITAMTTNEYEKAVKNGEWIKARVAILVYWTMIEMRDRLRRVLEVWGWD